MPQRATGFNARQLAFVELLVGSLIYVVVLGFLRDYTSIVEAKSFSRIFMASVVLEIMTYGALQLKELTVHWLTGRDGWIYTAAMFFCVWLIMFVSKFVFIGVLDLLFGNYVHVNGFFGILLVVVLVTVVHRLAYAVFWRLGDKRMDSSGI